MKVYIGPYRNWIGPYQIAEKIMLWKNKDDDIVHDFGTWLSGGVNGNSWLNKACQWIDSKKKRKIKVKIHPYDSWNAEATLAIIILPVLKQLQKTNHGAPFTDDEDVPEELRSTNAPPKKYEWETDDLHFQRWDYIMDEMIWAFEQIQPGFDWEDQYCSGKSDIQWIPTENENGVKIHGMKTGPNDTFKIDLEGREKHQDRMSNGFRLFGKYYQHLWD